MNKVDELVRLLRQQGKSQIPIQTEWCQVKEVNWDEKTMTAMSLNNELDYHDVLLGLGSIYKKPIVGCNVLVGVIEKGNATFIIDCEQFEEYLIEDESGFKWHLKEGELTLNGNNQGGIVKAPELKTQLDKVTARIDGIIDAIKNGIPAAGASDGGAGLHTSIKTALAAIVDKESFDDLQNEKIKHGN